MVLARLPQDYESDEVNVKGPLVNHPAFKHLSGRTGIVIIDLRDPDASYYDDVVTALPFSSGKYLSLANEPTEDGARAAARDDYAANDDLGSADSSGIAGEHGREF